MLLETSGKRQQNGGLAQDYPIEQATHRREEETSGGRGRQPSWAAMAERNRKVRQLLATWAASRAYRLDPGQVRVLAVDADAKHFAADLAELVDVIVKSHDLLLDVRIQGRDHD